MKKRKNIITVAIDSPAAAGAGTQAKLIAKEYNLAYLDTGKIYRIIGLVLVFVILFFVSLPTLLHKAGLHPKYDSKKIVLVANGKGGLVSMDVSNEKNIKVKLHFFKNFSNQVNHFYIIYCIF